MVKFMEFGEIPLSNASKVHRKPCSLLPLIHGRQGKLTSASSPLSLPSFHHPTNKQYSLFDRWSFKFLPDGVPRSDLREKALSFTDNKGSSSNMAKKRKSIATSLDEMDQTMYTSFCSATNPLSRLYTQAMNHQKLLFQAGERHRLEPLDHPIQALEVPNLCGDITNLDNQKG